jgi:hypothetical protein
MRSDRIRRLQTWLTAHRPSAGAIEGTAMAVILLVGLVRRINQLVLVAGLPLRPDAVDYRRIALELRLSHPYSTEYREPGWIWLARLWFEAFGTSTLELRILSMVFGMATIVASWWFARRFFRSRVVGVLVAALLATNAELIVQSAYGLRLEALSFFLVIFVAFTFLDDVRPGRRVAALAASGTAAVLVALTAFSVVIPLVAFAVWRHHLGLRSAVIVYGVIAVLLAPHLRYEQESNGDPFYASNIAAKFFRNYEFLIVKHTGCDGCPTMAEYNAWVDSGAKTTWAHYVFGMHDAGTVVHRFASGYRSTLLSRRIPFRKILGPRSLKHANDALLLAVIVGAAGILFSRRRWFLVVPPLLLGGLAFIVPLRIDWRLVEHLAPVMAMIAASSWLVALALARLAWRHAPSVVRSKPQPGSSVPAHE